MTRRKFGNSRTHCQFRIFVRFTMWMWASSSSPPLPKRLTQSMHSVLLNAKLFAAFVTNENAPFDGGSECACDGLRVKIILNRISSENSHIELSTLPALIEAVYLPTEQRRTGSSKCSKKWKRNMLVVGYLESEMRSKHMRPESRAGKTKPFYQLMCVVYLNELQSWSGRSVIY